jgi:hypothetical protein
MYVRVPLPRITPGALTNLLGVAGLIAIVVAVGMLAGAAWAVLAAGLMAVGLTVLAQLGQAQQAPASVSVAKLDDVRAARSA